MNQPNFKLAGTEERPMNIVVFVLKEYFHGRIIDVGCGNGRHLRLMPHNSVGVDLVPPPSYLKKKYSLLVHDLNNNKLPFRDGSFDVVFCSHVIEHLESPYKVLKEFHRILKRGGVLILGIPNPDCIFFDFYGLSKDPDWSEHLYAWDLKQAIRFITNCGFLVKKTYCNFPFSSNRFGLIWNMLPLIKKVSSDLWFVAYKHESRVYLRPSKKYLLGRILTKLFSGAMSQSPKKVE